MHQRAAHKVQGVKSWPRWSVPGVTFFYGELNPKTRKLIYTNAGHFPPVIMRKSGEIIELKHGGTVLGFIKNITYAESEIELFPGDIALFYTDGLIEARNRDDEFFELSRVIKIIQQNSNLNAVDIKNKLISEIYQFSGLSRTEDDLTFILMKVE